MAQTVIGLFEDADVAQRAVEQLEDNGFLPSEIDLTKGDRKDLAQHTDDGNDNGVKRFFRSLFGDNDEADRYARVGQSGCSIVTVHARTAEEARMAADLLDSLGALDVNDRAGKTQYNTNSAQPYTGSQFLNANDNAVENKPPAATSYNRNETEGERSTLNNENIENKDWEDSGKERGEKEQTIQRVEERMEVSKQSVENSSVRVRSRIVEKPVEENIRLREERVRVERNPVNRPVAENEMANFKEHNIELTESKEVPVITKEARVVEEIKVSKEVAERNETVRDSVRQTEIDIDNINRSENRDNIDRDDTRNHNLRNNDPIFGS